MKADFGFKYLISLSSLTNLALRVSWFTAPPAAFAKPASTIASESIANGCKWHVWTPTILRIIWTASCDFLAKSNGNLSGTWQWLHIETYYIYYVTTYHHLFAQSNLANGSRFEPPVIRTMSRHSWSLSELRILLRCISCVASSPVSCSMT